MYIKRSISLVVISTLIALSAGLANAHDVEVKAGNMQVSVDNGKVDIDSSTSQPTSLLDRISNWRIFGSRTPKPVVRGKTMNCRGITSGDRSTHTNSSGTGVMQSSSSSTTMTCN